MNRSENINELAGALSKAQGAISGAVKGKENPFYKSKYADLSAVMTACREPLSVNGIAIIQGMQFEGVERWIETLLVHSSGQWVSANYPVKPVKDDPQGLGSAITYARRYALMALVGIAAEDEDDDGNNASDKVGTGNKADNRPLPQSSPYSANPAPRNSNGNGTADHGKAAAAQWCKSAIQTVRAFSELADLAAWEGQYDDKITKLKGIDEGLHADLVGAMGDKYAKLNPLNAG